MSLHPFLVFPSNSVALVRTLLFTVYKLVRDHCFLKLTISLCIGRMLEWKLLSLELHLGEDPGFTSHTLSKVRRLSCTLLTLITKFLKGFVNATTLKFLIRSLWAQLVLNFSLSRWFKPTIFLSWGAHPLVVSSSLGLVLVVLFL